MPVKGIILLGGPLEGTRYRPLSLSTPKPLIELGMECVVSFHARRIAQLPGVSEILCMGYYDSAILEAELADLRASLSMPIRYLQEPKGFGTAGGLRHFREQIMEGAPEQIILIHGDIWCDYSLERIVEFHRSRPSKVTLLGVAYQKQSHRRAPSMYGCLATDPSSMLVQHWVEKPESFPLSCVNGGVYVLEPTMIERICATGNEIIARRAQESQNLTNQLNWIPHERLRLEEDILIPLIKEQCVYAFPFTSYWSPMKGANQVIRSLPYILSCSPTHRSSAVVVHPTAVIHPTASIGPAVSIGADVEIDEGVRLSHCIIRRGTRIHAHSYVRAAIVDEDCTIGYWSRVVGTASESATHPEDDQITVLGNSVEIGSEISIENSVILPHKIVTESVQKSVVL